MSPTDETHAAAAPTDEAPVHEGTPDSGTPVIPLAFDDWFEESPVSPTELNDLFVAFEKTARARRLYQDNNPVYQTFHKNLHDQLVSLWDRLQSLPIAVEEEGFRCFGHLFPAKDGREGLPFMFYRDGVRLMTLLPGFEEEVTRFLDVVDRARQFGPTAGDDIVTLLWQQEFSSFQYSYVDLLAESEVSAEEGAGAPQLPVERVSPEAIERLASGEEPHPQPPAVQAGEPPVAMAVLPEFFVETPYFLEPEEVEILQREVDVEWSRDLQRAVLDALFDRFEDHEYLDRRGEVIRIFGQLLPAYLGRGDLDTASTILAEVSAFVRSGSLSGDDREEALRLLRDLNDPQVLSGVMSALEEGSIDPSDEQLSRFLSFLNEDALPLLLRTTVAAGSGRLAQRLEPALEAIARRHPRTIVGLLTSQDAAVTLGAARLASRLQFPEARESLIALLAHGKAEARRAAVEALGSLNDGQSLAAVQQALTDADREVRITAARALAAARSRMARETLRTIITGRGMRDADLTEKIAFFEAFGAIADERDVEMLDNQLNGRRLLGTRESPELRACAAMALGRMALPNARAALQKARSDDNAMVRSAVARALRAEGRR